MRFRHRDGTVVYLAYCTNVHPAEDLNGVLRQLSCYAEPIRERLGISRLGLGLWLSAGVASQLSADEGSVDVLRHELASRGLEVVTLNGFPYEGFQRATVKRSVYSPDWSEQARLSYTTELARILTRLLPEDAHRGSVSTLPLAWRAPWFSDRSSLARRNLDELGERLEKLAADTGRAIRVGFEPEPGCVVETTAQAAEHLSGVNTDVLGVCLDACHLAVGFEDAGPAVGRLEDAGLPIVKAQVSVALRVPDPTDAQARARLARFDEPRFLHQTRERAGRRVVARDDLADALSGSRPLSGRDEWRVHFHLPLNAPPPEPLASTSSQLLDTLDVLLGGSTARTEHLEVETYTWNVLPDRQRPMDESELIEGIAAELSWTRERLVALGLEELR